MKTKTESEKHVKYSHWVKTSQNKANRKRVPDKMCMKALEL